MTTPNHHVAIIGAGPYGLATAAHLRSAGVENIVLGEPMEFWRTQMPAGMWLRSSWEASHISDPHRSFTLDSYEKAQNVRLRKPIPLEDFVRYGQWFQKQVVPDLDICRVLGIETGANGFHLSLSDGESIQARRVVIATGISKFAYRPPQFDGLPPALAAHSIEQPDLQQFSGMHVVVIGGGQSAIESAAILQEAGADVQVIMRQPKLRWLGFASPLRHAPKAVRYIFYPPSDVGPPVLNWIIALPGLFKKFPPEMQERIAYRCIRPAVSGWLRSRVRGVKITMGHEVVNATPQERGIRLTLDDGTERQADSVLLATGFRINIARLEFLSPELVQRIRRVDGYPVLSKGFESSVPGLHFVGAPGAYSFGPLLRFVAGAQFAAPRVARAITIESPARAPAVGDQLILQ